MGFADEIIQTGAGDILTINWQDNLDEVLGKIEHFAADQLPYAQASALWGVGLDAKAAMLAELFGKFTIRTGHKPWAFRALYLNPERKQAIQHTIREGGDASITIGSRSKLGELLTDGGTRHRKNGGEFNIPITGSKARPTPAAIARYGRASPKSLARRFNGFYLPSYTEGVRVLYMRTQPYRRGENDKRKKQALFVLKKEVQIKPWWNLRDILAAAMTTWLPQRFEEACNYAMRTRKPRN